VVAIDTRRRRWSFSLPELAAAGTAQAEKLSPFEYVAAEEYLHKAREESGYAQYESATTYASRARELAKEARKKALAASNKDQPEGAP